MGNLLCSYEKRIASNKTHKIMWRSSLKKKYRTKMIIQHDSYGHFAWSVASSWLQQITRAKTLQIPGKLSTLSRFDHHVWVLSLNTNGVAGFKSLSRKFLLWFVIIILYVYCVCKFSLKDQDLCWRSTETTVCVCVSEWSINHPVYKL